jgi:hypothetical protein
MIERPRVTLLGRTTWKGAVEKIALAMRLACH